MLDGVMAVPFFCSFVTLLVVAPATAAGDSVRAVTVDNVEPRRDANGNILNAHDGNIIHVDGRYWLIGTSYTHCNMTRETGGAGTCEPGGKCEHPMSPSQIPNAPVCGWTNNDFAAYSSLDLQNWQLENPSILPADKRPNGIYFRPKVVYNAKTGVFVLWFNFVTEGWDCPASFPHCWSTYGTATSVSPAGPFAIHKLPVLMGTGNASYAHGDFAIMVDSDSRAYVLYNAYDHRAVGQKSNSVDLLTDDYLSSSGSTSGFFAIQYDGGDEAQVLLHVNGTYYAIITHDCCFCPTGTNALVYKSASPLGPYALQGNINNYSAGGAPAQQSFVLQVETVNGPLLIGLEIGGKVLQMVTRATISWYGCHCTSIRPVVTWSNYAGLIGGSFSSPWMTISTDVQTKQSFSHRLIYTD